MAGIVNKVKALGFPTEQLVVIGSGLLDALGYRDSGDIDLVVTEELFERLKASGDFECVVKHGDSVLIRDADALEIWTNWSSSFPFSTLRESAVEIDGVWFANPEVIIEFKTKRNLEKDQTDITYLKEYLAHAA